MMMICGLSIRSCSRLRGHRCRLRTMVVEEEFSPLHTVYFSGGGREDVYIIAYFCVFVFFGRWRGFRWRGIRKSLLQILVEGEEKEK